MKNLYFVFIAAVMLSSCGGGNTNTETTKKEEAPKEKIESICLWDGASFKKEPNKNGKYLSSVSLGEKVLFLGETAIDSTDKNREYIKIELSDGTQGWSSRALFIDDAYVATIKEEAPIYKRPDMLTVTQTSFNIMDVIAVKDTKEDWIEVYGNKKRKKGWIKKNTISTDQEDVAVCVLAEKKIKKNDEIVVEKIEEFLSELPYKNSFFIGYLNELHQDLKAETEQTDEDEDVDEESVESEVETQE